MGHNHHNQHCSHDIKLCTHCDVVYCTMCSKEWKVPTNSNNIWQYTTPCIVPGTGQVFELGGSTYCGTGATITTLNSQSTTCSFHKHD